MARLVALFFDLMSELQEIRATVERTAHRRRWERAWHGFWLGLLAGAVLWLVVAVVFKLAPLPGWLVLTAALAGALSPLAGFVLAGWRVSPLNETARWIDARRQLKERLSTALEVSSQDNEWTRLLVRDAAEHARSIEARQMIPLRLPRLTRWAVLVLALGAGLGFVPEYRSQKFLQKQADAAHIKETGKQLAELTRRTLEKRPPALEPTQKAMNSVAELGQHLEKTPLTRGEALRDLANAAEKLSKEAQELAKNPALKPLERAARETASGHAEKSPEALQRQIDALQKSLGNDKSTPEALDKLKAGLDKLQRSAASLPDKDTAAGKAAREQLAQSLASLAQQARDMGQPVESLEAAIQALEKNQIDQFLKDLDIASTDLEKLKNMAQALSQLQQQAAKTGRDLAEQLQNGQADAARQTLEKMIEQVRSAALSNEQLQRILNEVSKAVDPAGEYGKVADYLKDAVKQMQQARQGAANAKSEAAQSLAQAAKELEKLGQQMGDMDALAATLESLDQAQRAIASGQGWGQCNKCGHCNGQGCAFCKGKGWGHGGSLSASGVGTWAEEREGWTYYPDKIPQTPVDNSGVVRPDLDPRGHTDRPAEVSDALRPTKVKGQMGAGGPMPSITLKGVSIKGQSTVQFSDAAAAAQSDAQNALNQDQVPRAYQNAVKDYFDDLKK